MIVRQIGDRTNGFVFRPAGVGCRAHHLSKSCLKRILATYVSVGIIVGHEGSCYISHDGKLN